MSTSDSANAGNVCRSRGLPDSGVISQWVDSAPTSRSTIVDECTVDAISPRLIPRRVLGDCLAEQGETAFAADRVPRCVVDRRELVQITV